jgi:hypothetical protein
VVDSPVVAVVAFAVPLPSDVDALPVALLVSDDVDDALLVSADVDDALLVSDDVDDALLVPAVDEVGSAWAKPLPTLSAARPRKPAIALAAVSFLMVSRLFMVVAFRCLLCRIENRARTSMKAQWAANWRVVAWSWGRFGLG